MRRIAHDGMVHPTNSGHEPDPFSDSQPRPSPLLSCCGIISGHHRYQFVSETLCVPQEREMAGVKEIEDTEDENALHTRSWSSSQRRYPAL